MKNECDDSETKPSAKPALQGPLSAIEGATDKLQRVLRLPVMYPKLQRLCKPQSENFWILGGRPGAFKTGLLWNLALNAVERRQRVLFVTLEMTPAEMALLGVSRFSGLTRERIETAFMPQDTVPFRDDEAALFNAAVRKVEGFENRLRMHGEEHGRSIDAVVASACRARFDAVFIDHLGMIGRDSGGRELDLLSSAIHRLRGLAKGEEVRGYRPWVCATSQLNREIDKGDEERIPRMSDFRGSARIEHDADVAIGLQKRRKEGDDEAVSLLDAFVLKNRNGPCPACIVFEANGAIGLVTERTAQQGSTQHWQERDD